MTSCSQSSATVFTSTRPAPTEISTTKSGRNISSEPPTFAPIADYGLLKKGEEALKTVGARCKVGNIVSSDVFYEPNGSWREWRKFGALCVEMESAALYLLAAREGKKALSFLTISDLLETGEELTPEERQTAFDQMIRAALITAEE